MWDVECRVWYVGCGMLLVNLGVLAVAVCLGVYISVWLLLCIDLGV